MQVEWLKPYTDDAIRHLGQSGTKSMLAVPVSFISEHIETLEEIDCEYRDLAEESGIVHWGRVPALGTNKRFIDDLADMVLEKLPCAAPCIDTSPLTYPGEESSLGPPIGEPCTLCVLFNQHNGTEYSAYAECSGFDVHEHFSNPVTQTCCQHRQPGEAWAAGGPASWPTMGLTDSAYAAGSVQELLGTYDRSRRVLPAPVKPWEWGWTRSAETWNGRIAMLAVLVLVLLEVTTGRAVLTQWLDL